ncbi:MAG: histidine kinase [Acidimicrobiales bacterium]|nr:histidine kinase [Acidimicrobiales bacterium]
MTRWLREHPQLGDAALILFICLSSAEALRRRPGSPALAITLAVGMALPLAFRRRHPAAVFSAVAAVAFVQWLSNIPVRPYDVAVLIALYSVAAYSEDRRLTLGAAVVTVGGAALAVARLNNDRLVPGMVAPLALTVVAIALGDDRRTRRAYFAGLEERAERLERERDALAEVAASGERARIARELHDVVAHSLSVMVAQADGAAYTVSSDPHRAGRAMETVAETGRDAMTEMRRLLGVLRTTSTAGDLVPQPGVAEIPALVDNVREAGLPVELTVDGPEVDLPAGMALAAYRIVQEALTNTIKHSGPGATASVALHFAADELTVQVDDDGAGIRTPDHDGSGQGLAGMRERAAMYGGSVRVGPRPEGGFVVAAAFPFRSTAP